MSAPKSVDSSGKYLMSRETALWYIDMGATEGMKILNQISARCPPGWTRRRWRRKDIEEWIDAYWNRDEEGERRKDERLG